jgi:PAS domain S-box-containing protein
VFGLKADFYYIISTFAVLIAVYFVFRYKIIVNTFYDSLKSALAVMNDVFITMDNQFHIEMAKGTAVTGLLQYQESELRGRPISSIIEHSSFLEEYKFLLSRQKMKESYFDSNVISKNGTRIPMNISFTPITVSGQITGFVSIFRDIRERKELEDQLRHAQKMKSLGTLAGGIAHDFNNILQIILLNTSRLKDREDIERGRLAKVVEVNEQAIQRGTDLVRQILTFARKTDVTFTVFRLQDFLPKFLNMIKETFPRTINFDLKQDNQSGFSKFVRQCEGCYA